MSYKEMITQFSCGIDDVASVIDTFADGREIVSVSHAFKPGAWITDNLAVSVLLVTRLEVE